MRKEFEAAIFEEGMVSGVALMSASLTRWKQGSSGVPMFPGYK